MAKAKAKAKTKTKKSAKPKVKAKSQAKAKKAKPKASPKKTRSVQKPQKSAQKKSKPSSKKLNISALVSPLDDRILVRLESTDRKTPGGLFIPDTISHSGHFQGEVVAVGRGHMDTKGRLHPLELRVGDRIFFSEFSGSKVKILEEELVILREKEVLGLLET